MKKPRLAQKFLEELSKVGVVSLACERVGLSRQTVYRWKEEDIHFRNSFDEAIRMGVSAMTDLAETKLYSNVNKGNQRAIEYVLNRRKKEFFPTKPEVQKTDPEYKGVTTFTIIRPPEKTEIEKAVNKRLEELNLPLLPND